MNFGGVGEFGAIVNKGVGVLMCWLLFNFLIFLGGYVDDLFKKLVNKIDFCSILLVNKRLENVARCLQ